MTNKIDYTVTAEGSVPDVADKLGENLSLKGYGILSRIDVQAILKEKNNQDIDPYLILDVCNPSHAGNAIEMHRGVGLVLPCKISVYRENGKTRISLLKPTESIRMTGFQDLGELAEKVESDLQKTIKSITE